MSPIVVKVGGSLLDWAELKSRLETFLKSLTPPILLVPGGGNSADAIREFDRVHKLGDDASHWLALRACAVNGHMLARLLGGLPMIAEVQRAEAVAVVDLLPFAQRDETRPDHWPHRWDVTSDSMAVRVAHVAGAEELILLKSTDVEVDWSAAAKKNQVDAFFPIALGRAPGVRVRSINLRKASP